METRGSRVRQVSRLLFKETSVNKMVRRITNQTINGDVTVGSAVLAPALGDKKKSIKKDGAWRYPGGIIQRMESKYVEGRGPYFDHKEPDMPRRKQESNFFITLNTNRSVEAGGELENVGKEAMRLTLIDLAKDRVIAGYLKFGPKHSEYQNDYYSDVIEKVEWNAAVEVGENLHRLHCHIWLTVHHYSQVQINMTMMQHVFKAIYNGHVDRSMASAKIKSELRANRMPYIQVKLLPESNWAEVMKQYIQKAWGG